MKNTVNLTPTPGERKDRPDIWATKNSDCPYCRSKFRHPLDAMIQYHPQAGSGLHKEHGDKVKK